MRPLALFIVSLLCACAIGCIGTLDAHAQVPDRPREIVSRVVLTNTYVNLNLNSLREKLDELYPGQFLPPRIKGSFVVARRVPGQFLIQSNVGGASGVFLLTSVPAHYVEFSTFAEAIADGPFRRRVEAQCCWISVDLLSGSDNEAEAYRFIEQVLAKLAPADAAFVVDPSKRITVVFDDELRRRFAGGEMILSSP